MSNDMKKYMQLIESSVEQVEDSKHIWSSSDGKIELELYMEDVKEIAVGGTDNESAVRSVMRKPYVSSQFNSFDSEVIKNVIYEHFADATEEELEDEDLNKIRLLWMAAWDIKEENE